MNAPFTLTDERADYLRELMNIGSGNAAATLSILLKTQVLSKIPEVRSIAVDDVLADIGDGTNPATGTILELSGDVRGLFLFYCRRDTARRFAALARLHEPRRSAKFDDLAVISIVAQVVAGSHLATVRRFCGLHIDHTWKESTPDLARTLREGLTAWRDAGNEKVVVVRSEFALVDFHLNTFLVIIPDQRSLPVLTGSAIEAKQLAVTPPERLDLPTTITPFAAAAAGLETPPRITLTGTELDYLTELMNIGAGNAAGALSALLRCRVDSGMPNVRICPTAGIAAVLVPLEERFTGVKINLSGDVSGFVYFIIPAAVERCFSRMARPPGEQGTELEGGPLLALAAQAVVTSYMAAVKKFCGLDIQPSPPEANFDVGQALIFDAASGEGRELNVLVIQTDFTIHAGGTADDQLITYLLMFTEADTVPVLIGSIAEATRRITGGA